MIELKTRDGQTVSFSTFEEYKAYLEWEKEQTEEEVEKWLTPDKFAPEQPKATPPNKKVVVVRPETTQKQEPEIEKMVREATPKPELSRANKTWKPKELRTLKKMARGGESDEIISKVLGRTVWAVKARRSGMSLPKKGKQRRQPDTNFPDSVLEAAERLAKKGKPITNKNVRNTLRIGKKATVQVRVSEMLRKLCDDKKLARAEKAYRRFEYSVPGIKSEKPEVKVPRWTAERRQFISKKMSKYMSKDWNWPVGKARAQAEMDWQSGPGKITPQLETEIGTPKVTKVQKQLVPVLRDMLRNVAAQNGQLRYKPDGEALNVSSVHQWRELVLEVANKFAEWAKYFGTQNKFKLEQTGAGLTIKYG